MNQSKHAGIMEEKVYERFATGFGSIWTRKWHEIFKPITKCINVKPKQMQITFDTQVLYIKCKFKSTNVSLRQCAVRKYNYNG